MDIRTKIGSRKHMKAPNLAGHATVVTIKRVEEKTVGQGRDAELKVVLYFAETDKGLVLITPTPTPWQPCTDSRLLNGWMGGLNFIPPPRTSLARLWIASE